MTPPPRGLAFLDIDTQIDFLYPAGSLPVPGAYKLIPRLSQLNHAAAARGIPLISTVCAHTENDSEFREWPPHCVLGTVGQQKPASLLVGQRLFEKQQTNLFASPLSSDLVSPYEEFVLYGVVTEVCVSQAALGLLARGKKVTVVGDAIQAIDLELAQAFRTEFETRGGQWALSHTILHAS